MVADEHFKAYGTELLGLGTRFKVHGTDFLALLANQGIRYGRNDQDDDSCSFASYRKPQMFRIRLTVRSIGRFRAV